MHSVLIVGNDAFVSGMYARRFEFGKWDVTVVESEKEADKYLEHKIPEAILIDVEAGEKSFSFLEKLRKENTSKSAVLIALVKLGEDSQIEKALKSGADSYLLKGHFVPAEVEQKVERLVAEKE